MQEVQTGGSDELHSHMCNMNSENTHQKKNVSCKMQINYNDDDFEKEATRSKNLTFTDDSEGDAVHRRLERDQHSSRRDGEAVTSHDLATDVGGNTSGVSQHYQVEFDEKYKNRLLPITTRGQFSDDSFFRDCRINFKAAVKEVLQKAQEPSSDDEIAAYRSLRRRNLKLENQAVHVDDDLRYQTVSVRGEGNFVPVSCCYGVSYCLG